MCRYFSLIQRDRIGLVDKHSKRFLLRPSEQRASFPKLPKESFARRSQIAEQAALAIDGLEHCPRVAFLSGELQKFHQASRADRSNPRIGTRDAISVESNTLLWHWTNDAHSFAVQELVDLVVNLRLSIGVALDVNNRRQGAQVGR